MDFDALTEQSLIDLLLNPTTRERLFTAMAAEGEPRSLTNRFAELARHCQATSEQLRVAIAACLDDDVGQRYVHWLLLHPDVPGDMLLTLARQEDYLTILAHRHGPRELLEYLASHYRISEAITTLALNHYRHEDDAAFAAFIAEHASDYMLRWNLRRAELTPGKRAIADMALSGKPQ